MVLKNTEKSIMVLGGKHPTGNSLINSQKPIFPRSVARMSHSKVHETENVLDAAIEAVEVQTMKNRYSVLETAGLCLCHAFVYGGT
jgi:ribosomal protein S7